MDPTSSPERGPAMQPARGHPLLPALVMLTLALSSPGVQGAPRGRSAQSEADPESKPLSVEPAAADLVIARAVRAQPAAAPALRSVSSAEIFPRDLKLKDKFIKHFRGSITFSGECSKHFHRLYYNTRDCSIPTYYKRCARLLTRLAMNPLCTQT